MIKKKGKFLTTIFSCIPGGGQMYMGFMKEGLSLMGMFFFILFLSSWLNIGPMLYVLPVLWFYSFFDAMNSRAALSANDTAKNPPPNALSTRGINTRTMTHVGMVAIYTFMHSSENG